MRTVKLRKLDRRYKGVDFWSHRLEITVRGDWEVRQLRVLAVHEARTMLTQNFGTGCHVDDAYVLRAHGIDIPKWGFNNDGDFFLREEALVLMELSKGRWEK